MENLLICTILLLGCGTMAVELLTAVVLWKMMGRETQGTEACPAGLELPEEQEARRLAAEAQRLYEQGFVNLMRYDGSPGRKESEW